jgi:hypothetical protein
MKVHHAAALALVGWYLMTPPRPHLQLDTRAPLFMWSFSYPQDAFKTEQDCELELGRRLREDRKQVDRSSASIRRSQELQLSRCVSADDPGLKYSK